MEENVAVVAEPADSPGAQPTDQGSADQRSGDQGSADRETVDELLVEEVSIDGMCGVY